MTPLPTFAQYVANEWRALRDEYGAAALRGLRPADLPRLRCRHDNALSARQRHAP